MHIQPVVSDRRSIAPADRWVLHEIEALLCDLSLVDSVRIDPDRYEPRRVRATLNTNEWSNPPHSAEMVIYWSTDGDFSIEYREDLYEEESWRCQWNCYLNPDNETIHFHAPPDGERVKDVSLPSFGEGTAYLKSPYYHPVDVVLTTLGTIAHNRIRD